MSSSSRRTRSANGTAFVLYHVEPSAFIATGDEAEMPSPVFMTKAARCIAVSTAARSNTGSARRRASLASVASAKIASSGFSRPAFLKPATKLSRSMVSSVESPESLPTAPFEKKPSFAAALNISSPIVPRYAPAIIFSKGLLPGVWVLASIARSNLLRAILLKLPDSAFMIIFPAGSRPESLRMFSLRSTYAVFVPVPSMKPRYDEYSLSPSVAFAARSVATVSFTMAIFPPPSRERSSLPTNWPTIAGAFMPLVQRMSLASRSAVASAGYEKQKPILSTVARGLTRRTSFANAE